ncbi:MAG: DUF4176 domain-containing protein [Lachnospiraceae bacterium]|nr:DUF4176 domain-containing protein [Lachnospiraceae bacterium]
MIRDFLPIGSVVMLKEAEKPLMIYGIKQFDSDNPDVEYDYIGVVYPEGNIGAEFQYLFNHEDIEKVLFRGYDTPEYKEFLDEVAKAYGE